MSKQVIEIEWKEFTRECLPSLNNNDDDYYFIKFDDGRITIATHYYGNFWPVHTESTYDGCGECVFYGDITHYGEFKQ